MIDKKYNDFKRGVNKNKDKPTTGENAVKGVLKFILSKGLHEDDLDSILSKYRYEIELKTSYEIELRTLERVGICEEIQKDFGKFVTWFKANYK